MTRFDVIVVGLGGMGSATLHALAKAGADALMIGGYLVTSGNPVEDDKKMIEEAGMELYGSPTLSDQALMSFPSIKIGPGESERSHTANEFIYLDELKEGIDGYLKFIDQLKL